MNKQARELLKKNNSREKDIFDENKEIYTNMIVYLRGSNLSDYDQEVVREDIIELIIDGQQRGDNIEKVMGGRYKEICDEIIEAMPQKTKKDKIIKFVDTSLNALWILGVIALVKNLISSFMLEDVGFNFILTVGDLITTVIIIIAANMIVWFITKTAFDKEKNSVVSFLKLWFIVGAIFAVILLSNIYFKTIIVTIPFWLAMIIVLFIFVIERKISEIS